MNIALSEKMILGVSLLFLQYNKKSNNSDNPQIGNKMAKDIRKLFRTEFPRFSIPQNITKFGPQGNPQRVYQHIILSASIYH